MSINTTVDTSQFLLMVEYSTAMKGNTLQLHQHACLPKQTNEGKKSDTKESILYAYLYKAQNNQSEP